MPSLKDCYEEGYDFVNCGADVTAIGANCESIKGMYDEITARMEQAAK